MVIECLKASKIIENGLVHVGRIPQDMDALDKITGDEYQLLKSGERALNKHAREWAKK